MTKYVDKLSLDEFNKICSENNYLAGRLLPDGRWAALAQFIFTVGILVGRQDTIWSGYDRRYCYHHYTEAVIALVKWQSTGYQGKPKGYITEK